MNIAVLASGGGSTLQFVMDAIDAGKLAAHVCVVVSNNSRSGAMERAANHNVPTAHISGATHPDDDDRDQAIADVLKVHEAEIVLLAGYMKQLGPSVLATYEGRILNTHPALLPKFGGPGFYGLRVHQAVIDAGETQSGATVHIVTEEYDSGPMVAQVTVNVKADDDAERLQERVKVAERKLLLEVLQSWPMTQNQDQSQDQQIAAVD